MPRIYAKDNVTTAKPDMITATDVGTKRALDVNIADGEVVVVNTSSLGHGIKNVTTSGTDVALAEPTPCTYVIIQARLENSGIIAVGGIGVDATAETGTGVILSKGDSIALDIDDLADVYIDSTVSGDGVRFTYGVA